MGQSLPRECFAFTLQISREPTKCADIAHIRTIVLPLGDVSGSELNERSSFRKLFNPPKQTLPKRCLCANCYKRSFTARSIFLPWEYYPNEIFNPKGRIGLYTDVFSLAVTMYCLKINNQGGSEVYRLQLFLCFSTSFSFRCLSYLVNTAPRIFFDLHTLLCSKGKINTKL